MSKIPDVYMEAVIHSATTTTKQKGVTPKEMEESTDDRNATIRTVFGILTSYFLAISGFSGLLLFVNPVLRDSALYYLELPYQTDFSSQTVHNAESVSVISLPIMITFVLSGFLSCLSLAIAITQ